MVSGFFVNAQIQRLEIYFDPSRRASWRGCYFRRRKRWKTFSPPMQNCARA